MDKKDLHIVSLTIYVITCNKEGLGQKSVFIFLRFLLFSEVFINIDDHEYANMIINLQIRP